MMNKFPLRERLSFYFHLYLYHECSIMEVIERYEEIDYMKINRIEITVFLMAIRSR